MTPDDVQALFGHLQELQSIGRWLATILAVNAGLIAMNIVASTIQIRLSR